jgi:nucleoside-diphosphate-sugar epimerase
MRILITGGTGLIGSAVFELLSWQYNDIWIISRKRPNYRPEKWVPMDIENVSESLKTLDQLGKFDVLIHNAANLSNPSNIYEYSKLVNCNILFTSELFKWAEKNINTCIIYTSGLSFIQRPIPVIIDENAITATNGIYPFSKLAGEQLLALTKTNAKKIILRISSPVSSILANMHQNVITKMINSAMQTGLINVHGKGDRKQDFVSVKDISKAILNCIQMDGPSGTYNIASGNMIKMRELANLIAEKSNAKIEFTGIDPMESEIWNISIEKAKREIAYKPLYTSRSAIENLLNNL